MKTPKQKAISAEIEFMNWCIKQGKIKIYFPGHTPETLHKEWKKK